MLFDISDSSADVSGLPGVLFQLILSPEQRSKDIMECYCPHNSVIEEWWVIAVHLMKSYSFADGFYVNIDITLQGKILCKGHK